jgi:hypothetical protein
MNVYSPVTGLLPTPDIHVITADSISERITATTEIPNEERPPDWVCDDETDSEAEGMQQEGCDQPKQKTVAVDDLLWGAFAERLPLVFVGAFLAWPMYAVGLHVLSALAGGKESFLDTLAVAAWGMLPTMAQALVGLGVLYVALGSIDLAASDPERLASQVKSLRERAQGNNALISLVVACWQGYVWTFGLKHARNLSTGGAAFAGGGVAMVVFLVGLA